MWFSLPNCENITLTNFKYNFGFGKKITTNFNWNRSMDKRGTRYGVCLWIDLLGSTQDLVGNKTKGRANKTLNSSALSVIQIQWNVEIRAEIKEKLVVLKPGCFSIDTVIYKWEINLYKNCSPGRYILHFFQK